MLAISPWQNYRRVEVGDPLTDARSRGQLRVRNPNLLLLRLLLARAHRHAGILRTIPVSHAIFSIPESRRC